MELPLNINNTYHSQKEHIINVHKTAFSEQAEPSVGYGKVIHTQVHRIQPGQEQSSQGTDHLCAD